LSAGTCAPSAASSTNRPIENKGNGWHPTNGNG
jgi:hypothetical protein